jgi:hypothetical protein
MSSLLTKKNFFFEVKNTEYLNLSLGSTIYFCYVSSSGQTFWIRGSTSTAGKKFLMWNKREEIGRRGREERKHRIC